MFESPIFLRHLYQGCEHRRGFTLIELLVVIVIVGILSGIAVPTYLNQVRRARTAEARTALVTVTRGSQIYRTDTGLYPCNYTDIAASPGNFSYMDRPFHEIAPNYGDPVITSGDCSSTGIAWTTVALATSPAYTNNAGLPLECTLGIGTESFQTTQNCNL